MSQGFETKSADATKNSGSNRQPKQVADIGSIQQSLVEHFSDIKDPRVDRTKKHQLTDILVIAILAVIAGAQGWEDIENYGISKQQWLEEFLVLPNGIPSDDTFRRVFEFINPEELNRCFLRWVETLVTKMGGEIIPIDGKTIRGSYDRNQGVAALHVISAWAGLQTLVMVVRVRHLWNKTTREVQFYLTSLNSDAQLIGRAIRKHWGIENQAHWTLDCTFTEDACRIRSFHSPQNFALLRRLALNALNREQTYKRSLRQKMKRTGMDNDYMIQVLSSCFIDSTLDSSQPLCQA
jgi:predicted transposase YbfD/YdcC